VDWLIGSTGVAEASERGTSLLQEHLRHHATNEASVRKAETAISKVLGQALADAGSRPVLVTLDWSAAQPVLTAVPVEPGEGADDVPLDAPIPALRRQQVRSWVRGEAATTDLDVARLARQTFASGPPPVVDPGIDVEAQGAGAVAVAMAAALEAHPSSSAIQTASMAGAMIAGVAAEEHGVETPQAAAEAFVQVHQAMGGEAVVIEASEERLELAVRRCPFQGVHKSAGALCHVTSGIAGQLAAKTGGQSLVVLDETIVSGDPECHLQVLMGSFEDVTDAGGEVDGDTYTWPQRRAGRNMPAPHLDLSVSLPREGYSVPVIRRMAAQALRAFGVHSSDVDDVQLAITEACANVIDHAGDTDTYDVQVELAADRCAITVVDQGGGFDAANVPDRPAEESEEGRGLALMRALVDNVAFRNEPMAGTVVHMVKSLRYDADHPLHRG
jgi:serine/threonine-protein kinase RsbW